ncbi:MAG TPA: glycosyltransferase [Phycisphaerales bacterium]|nr:glycosyltransferase [Phycisphaerales bacterium]
MPKTTIITVTRNSAETISGAIESVQKQTFPEIEHIIIDGKSSDETHKKVSHARTQLNSRISRFLSEPDEGIYDAMNKGIALATGDIIGILNADDFYASDSVVSNVVESMESQQLDAVYADLVYVEPEDTSKAVRFWKSGDYIAGAFGKGWVPPHPTFFCRREVYEKYGYFRDDMKIAADFELMLRFIEKHQIKVGYLPQTIVKMRTGGKAYGWKGRIAGNIEILKAFKLNNLKPSPFYFINKPIVKIVQIFKRPACDR